MKTSRKKTDNAVAIKPSGQREGSFLNWCTRWLVRFHGAGVTSYGAIAACLGTKKSARMVGWAMNDAHRVIPTVPAHRVVNRVGLLSGKHHFLTETRMQELLEEEGIKVKDDQVVEFKKHFWDPSL